MNRYASALRALLVATAALAVAGCAGVRGGLPPGPDPDSTKLDEAVEAAAAAPAKVCRTERPVGTRVAMRVCRTEAEIAAERIQARQAIAEARELRGRVRGGLPRS